MQMKKFLTFLMCVFVSTTMLAKNPIVSVDENANGQVVLLNDSTIEYFNVYGIQVAQRSDIYTAIIKLPDSKKEKPELMIMQPGSYIWMNPHKKPGHYILFSGKSFDRVVLRAKDYQ